MVYLGNEEKESTEEQTLAAKAYYRFYMHLEINHFPVNRKLYQSHFKKVGKNLNSKEVIQMMMVGLYNFGDSHRVMQIHFHLFKAFKTADFEGLRYDSKIQDRLSRLVMDYFAMLTEREETNSSFYFLQKFFLCLNSVDFEIYLSILDKILLGKKKFKIKRNLIRKTDFRTGTLKFDKTLCPMYLNRMAKTFRKLVERKDSLGNTHFIPTLFSNLKLIRLNPKLVKITNINYIIVFPDSIQT